MYVENPHNQIVWSLHQETQKILSSASELGSSKNQAKICLLWKGINEKITNINKITFCLSQGTSLFLKKKKKFPYPNCIENCPHHFNSEDTLV